MPLTTLPSIFPDKSVLSQKISETQPKSLMTLCSWWERTHAKADPLPHICHEFTSPDKLLTSYMAPPRQYNFVELASDMLDTSNSAGDNDMVEAVEHAVDTTGRSIGLVGISLGVLFILFIIAFISCIKRRKTVQTDHVYPHPSIDRQVIVTLGTSRGAREEDIPPDYSQVVTMKEEEDQDLPSYIQAVEGHHSSAFEGIIDSKGEKEEISEYDKDDNHETVVKSMQDDVCM